MALCLTFFDKRIHLRLKTAYGMKGGFVGKPFRGQPRGGSFQHAAHLDRIRVSRL
jgi:hypothetical protein